MDRRQGHIAFEVPPEARLAELEEKFISGNITDEERREFGELSSMDGPRRGLASDSDDMQREAMLGSLQSIRDKADDDMFSRHSELIRRESPDAQREREFDRRIDEAMNRTGEADLTDIDKQLEDKYK